MKTLSQAIALASLVTASALTAQAANAEVEYSAGLATTYLWRGTDLGGAAFSAAADYSHDSGLFAGLWVSSGDLATGNEYDLYAGYATELSGVSLDLGYYTYAYANSGDDSLGGPGELEEAILNVGYGDASFSYIANLGSDYTYMTFGYSLPVVDVSFSMSDDGAGAEYSVIDLGFGLTEELSLAISAPIDDTAGVDEDVIVVMSYSLPIE